MCACVHVCAQSNQYCSSLAKQLHNQFYEVKFAHCVLVTVELAYFIKPRGLLIKSVANILVDK